jgi:hypothetical protein
MLCSRYNVAKDMFLFERLPENLATMDARSVRNELSKIRDIANEISSDMAKVLEKTLSRRNAEMKQDKEVTVWLKKRRS